MAEKKKKLSGSMLEYSMYKILLITVTGGVPIVMLFMVYLTGGGLESLKTNWMIFGGLLTIATAIIIFAVILHARFLKISIAETAKFIDNDEPKRGESAEDYKKRASRALTCTLVFPIRGAGLSFITWPLVLAVVLTVIFIWFFAFPISMAAALVSGGVCSGVLVTNFQFYLFKKALIPYQRHIMSLYPDYIYDKELRAVPQSLRSKLTISTVSLMVMLVLMLAIFSVIDGAKSLFFEWGKQQKLRITREMSITDLNFSAATDVDSRKALIDRLDDRSGAKFYLFDSTGNDLLSNAPSDKTALFSALANRTYRAKHNLVVPFPADKNVSMNLEYGDIGINAVVEIPNTNMVIIARSYYGIFNHYIVKMVTGSLIVVGIALLVGIIFSMTFSRELTEPLRHVVEAVDKVSSGIFAEHADLITHDEMGLLSMNFKSMLRNLGKMISEIGDASKRVDDTASKIVGGFSSISEGSKVQTKAVEDTSASMEEMHASIKGIGENIMTLASTTQETSASINQMSASIKEVSESVENLSHSIEESTSSISQMSASINRVAENIDVLSVKAESTVASVQQMESSIGLVQKNSKSAAEMSETVASNALDGRTQIMTTIDGIDRARASSELAVTVIKKLEARATEIGNIITVIGDVTDQTNLLALNAAIIAAQAGEHGRGFAVVAEEIKNLSERTAQSTEEINQLIETVQREAKEAAEAVIDGFRAVDEGSDLSRQAGRSLETMLQSAQQSAMINRDIAQATVDQVMRTTEVLKFFEEISNSINELKVAAKEQAKGSDMIMNNSKKMRDISKQVKTATMEQNMGTKQIIEATESISEIIHFINGSQKEQIDSTRRVVESVAGISRIASKNEGDIEDIYKAGENLSNLAESLREMVKFFKFEKSSRTA